MASFRYRAVRFDGSAATGTIEASNREDALDRLRQGGAAPLELIAVTAPAKGDGSRRRQGTGRDRAAAVMLIGELAVLLKAGLPLDRALGLAITNIEDPAAAANLVELLRMVREGVPLSRAMAANPQIFSPAAVAMAEAGEANGELGEALTRLSAMLEQAAELRRLVATSMIYPIALMVIAVGVILMMLLFVVPQFEQLLSTTRGDLPAASLAVLAASRFVRHDGLLMLGALVGLLFAARQALRQASVRARLDRAVLGIPQFGELIRRLNTARFAHTLGALLDGGVPLPAALALAQRTISNGAMAAAVAAATVGVRQGGSLTAAVSVARVFPRLAIGFLRTGEETSQLGMMLGRLAAVLDRDVRTRLQRLIAVLTPAITVVLGATVAAIIASIMSAILGFNDLAVAQ